MTSRTSCCSSTAESNLQGEVADLPAAPRAYVRRALDALTRLRDYEYGVEGALAGPGSRTRAREVTVPRLEQLAR